MGGFQALIHAIRARPRFRLRQIEHRLEVLAGMIIIFLNLDEVIRVIRESADAPTARAALMNRDWPAGDVGVLLALVDDYRNAVSPEGTVRLTEEQARAIGRDFDLAVRFGGLGDTRMVATKLASTELFTYVTTLRYMSERLDREMTGFLIATWSM